MPLTGCLSDDVLRSLLLGTLDDDASEPAEAHLLSCPECVSRTRGLQASDTLVAALRGVGDVRWNEREEVVAQELGERLSDAEHLATLTTTLEATHITEAPNARAAGQTSDSNAPLAATGSGTALPPTRPPRQADLSLPSQTMFLDLAAGSVLGAYRLESKLGEGGMGAVWKAYHTRLKKYVALKVLPPRLLRDAGLVARFEREMEAVGRLDHPAIVRAMDAGDVLGVHYLVMEYVEGTDLGHLVRDRGPLPVKEACELVQQAAVGLAYAHRNGLVHRDIKPSNLFLTKQGMVKILDLGLARLQGDSLAADAGAGLTGTGQILGTPDYMAPEQWENTHTAGPACDLYALGCTLFFLLTGRAPYGDDRHNTLPKKMMGHVHEAIPDLCAARQASVGSRPHESPCSTPGAVPGARGAEADESAGISPTVVAIYRRLMAKDPTKRYVSAEELSAALQAVIESTRAVLPASVGCQPHESSATRDESPHTTIDLRPVLHEAHAPRSPASRTKLVLGGIGATLLLGVIVITIKYRDGTSARIEVPEGGHITLSQQADETGHSIDSPPSHRTKTASGWQGWPADAPKPAIAPFNAAQAKRHQEEWAKYLKVPVEYTNSIGMKFRLIPPGEFIMGSTREEIEETLATVDPNDRFLKECVTSEGPRHLAILTRPTYLGTCEVTQAEYEKVMRLTPSFFAKTGVDRPLAERVEGLDTANHPVEGINWYDAIDFCVRLSQQEKLKSQYFKSGETVTPLEGTGYRLPTEAEWEFACRAGTTTKFWNGAVERDLTRIGWYTKNSAQRTHSAEELKPNPFGLCDVHGNVYEWVQDLWDGRYYSQFEKVSAIDPSGPSPASSERVVRGGFWNNPALWCRSSFRFALDPTHRACCFGIRVSLTIDAVRQAIKEKGTSIPSTTASAADLRPSTGKVWHGWPVDAPKPAIAPFNAAQAKKHQEEWAAYLKLPVEYTNSIGLKFRLIPPGEYARGSAPEEIEAALKEADPNNKVWIERIKSEATRHTVILTQPIYLGATEVTQAEYQKVMGRNPSHFCPGGPGKAAVAGIDTAEHPVEKVPWNDAAEFCARLSAREQSKPSTGYRLPSEAEWEFACRAGTTTTFWSGDREEDLGKAGWFHHNSGDRTHAVGELEANPFGLFDIHGNVGEWVQDAWDATWYGQFQQKPAIDPVSPFSAGARRLIRGGSWTNTSSLCRSSNRNALIPIGYHDGGFRVALSVDAVRQALKVEGPKTSTSASVTRPSTLNTPSSLGWHGWPSDAPKPAIAPFDAAQAKRHQQEWAKYLKVPVEYTNSIGIKFRLMPPGEFTMGSTPEEIAESLKQIDPNDKHWQDYVKSEAPRHRVILTQPIYLGATEVTQAEYEKVMGSNPSYFAKNGPDKHLAERIKGLDTSTHPVENVNWNDAAEFCAKLSQLEKMKPFYFRAGETVTSLEGAGYRLPTEAECEFACRAGTTTRFWSGDKDEDLRRAGWFVTNSGERTHAAGELKANPFGLHDIHGNVWEWVQDGWEPTYYGQFQEQSAIDPEASSSAGSLRLFRGGVWRDPSFRCRSSLRHAHDPTVRGTDVGFRVSLVADAVRKQLNVQGP